MAVLMRLDHRGHGLLAEWDTDPVSRAAAKKVFDQHRAVGYNMADITTGDGTFIKEFDPNAQEILAVPPLVAG